MRRNRINIVLIFCILIGGVYLTYRHFSVQGSAMQGGMPGMGGGAAPVSVAEVIERNIQQWQEFSGRLVAVDSAEIRPQVSGIVEKVHFNEGEYVYKGDMLFTIDQRPYEAALEAADAQFTLAESELKRAEILLSEKAIPQREYDQRKNNADVAWANLTRAQLDYEYTLIRAPISGRVSRAEVTVGNLVNVGMPVLTTVISDRPIYADFEMDERAFLQFLRMAENDVKKLQSVPVRLGLADETDMAHLCSIQSFDNQLNTQTGTIRVRARCENTEGKLLPGLFARLHVGNPSQTNAILITEKAIGTDQDKKFVLVVGNENKVEYRPVILGEMADGLRVVREGLKAGEKIIVNGTQRAHPGMPVMPEIVPMEKNGETNNPGEKKE